MESASANLRKNFSVHPFRNGIIAILLVLGLWSLFYRLLAGLGASTNLNDAWPWGIWISFKLCMVPMGGCGFVMAALVYIFGIEKLRPLLRLGVLCGMLLYAAFVILLIADLGLPWRIYHPIYMWQPESIMFEIAWCVMLYLTVLIMEFLPNVAERLPNLAHLIRMVVMVITGVVVVMIVAVFGKSIAAIGVAILALAIIAGGAYRRGWDLSHTIVVVLVIEGIILSVLHQSSLGSLFLITKHKMEALFFSPLIPFFFFITSITGGLALLMSVGIATSWAVNRKIEMPVYQQIAGYLPYVLAFYLVFRVMDIVIRGNAFDAFEPTITTSIFWFEILIGVVAPMTLYLLPDVLRSERGIFWTSVLVVFGLWENRFIWTLLGQHPFSMSGQSYFPSFMEFMILILMVILLGITYRFLVRNVPVFPEGPLAEKRL
ncbi:MAG: NrfD/PsrC family molybdoenzyme membrane anchor subunit [Candidatus Glassbacteria bacterium]